MTDNAAGLPITPAGARAAMSLQDAGYPVGG